LRAWFWVEAETFCSVARYERKVVISGVLIVSGCRLSWKRMKRLIHER